MLFEIALGAAFAGGLAGGVHCAGLPRVLAGAVFWWALRRGQFDDLEGPAHRILMDDD